MTNWPPCTNIFICRRDTSMNFPTFQRQRDDSGFSCSHRFSSCGLHPPSWGSALRRRLGRVSLTIYVSTGCLKNVLIITPNRVILNFSSGDEKQCNPVARLIKMIDSTWGKLRISGGRLGILTWILMLYSLKCTEVLFSSKKIKPHKNNLHDFIVRKASMRSLSPYYMCQEERMEQKPSRPRFVPWWEKRNATNESDIVF